MSKILIPLRIIVWVLNSNCHAKGLFPKANKKKACKFVYLLLTGNSVGSAVQEGEIPDNIKFLVV